MIRKTKVVLGPFSDYEKKGTTSAIEIISDGTPNTLAVNFSVKKFLLCVEYFTQSVKN